MEWVEGLDLGRYIKAYKQAGQKTPWPLIAAIGIESLRGLGAAHERIDGIGRRAPVIHRDVTPQNILIGTNGIIKLTDFGLSRAADRARMTHPKIIKGKLAYLSPEVAWGKEATEQSDIFCLALVLWEALSGHQVYQGKSDVDVFLKARKAEIPSIYEFRDDLPAELVGTLERALAQEINERFISAQQMLRSLAALLRKTHQPTDAMEISRSVIQARDVLGISRRNSDISDAITKVIEL
jgi:serine/threonine-protein kinase